MSDVIQIIAPAFYANLTAAQKKQIENSFKKNGYTTRWGKNTFHQTAQFGATDKERLFDLEDAFQKNTSVIMAIRGGYGSARLLPLIKWNVLKKSSSLFVGFSDTTTFQNAYYAKTGKPSITGMLAKYATAKPQETVISSFFNALNGGAITFNGLPSITKGKASGILVGGNLTCFANLIGTLYLPNLKGKILLLEDVDEAPYRIDRMLTHLKNAGIFDKLNGVLLGDFYHCRNDDDKSDDAAYQVLKNFFKGFKIPVIYGLPYGHTPQHFCLPFGTKATLDTTKKTVYIDGIKKK